jgi:hypothetical protein
VGGVAGNVEIASNHNWHFTEGSRFFKHLRQERVVALVRMSSLIMRHTVHSNQVYEGMPIPNGDCGVAPPTGIP